MPGPDPRNLTAQPVNTNRTTTVASGATTSEEVCLGGDQLVGIFVPSNFDGTDITITAASASGGTFLTVQAAISASTAYTIVTTASRYVPISPSISAGLSVIKLVCTTQQATSDTVFTLATRPV